MVILAALDDDIMFALLQLAGIVLLLVAMLIDLHTRGSGIVVRRGKRAWDYLSLAYGFALLIILEIVSLTEAFPHHKTSIALLDIAAVTYLVFFNSWFRNKLLGFLVASETKEEHH
jgi:hypothetical protein